MSEISWSAIGQKRELCAPYSLREAPQLSDPPATIDNLIPQQLLIFHIATG